MRSAGSSRGCCRATAVRPASASAPSSRSCARTRSATTCATSTPPATARTGQAHVRLHVPERALTTWIVLDVSPSMAFGTARRLKADVAEGVALVFGRLGVRRAGSVGLVAFGAAAPRVLPPRGVQARDRRAAAAARRGRRARRPARRRTGSPTRCARVGRLARQPGLVVVDRDFRDQQSTGSGRSARSASGTRCSRSRSSIRARRELPARRTPGAGRSRERGADRGRHLHAGACASASPSSSASGATTLARELRAPAGRPGDARRPTRTGCWRSGRQLR